MQSAGMSRQQTGWAHEMYGFMQSSVAKKAGKETSVTCLFPLPCQPAFCLLLLSLSHLSSILLLLFARADTFMLSCACIHTRKLEHACSFTNTRTHAHTHARTHARAHTHIHTRARARTHARTHTHTHARKNDHVQMCTQAIIYTYMHIFILCIHA